MALVMKLDEEVCCLYVDKKEIFGLFCKVELSKSIVVTGKTSLFC